MAHAPSLRVRHIIHRDDGQSYRHTITRHTVTRAGSPPPAQAGARHIKLNTHIYRHTRRKGERREGKGDLGGNHSTAGQIAGHSGSLSTNSMQRVGADLLGGLLGRRHRARRVVILGDLHHDARRDTPRRAHHPDRVRRIRVRRRAIHYYIISE